MAESMNIVERLVVQMGERVRASANVEVAFGPSRTIDNRTFIPVAKVAYGFGAGGGMGPAPKAAGESATGEAAVAGGGGGGGGVSVSPIALVEITSDGARIMPIVDVNRLITLAVAVVGLVLIARLLRR